MFRRPGEPLLFTEFLVLGLVLATVVGTGAALGAVAFFRLKRYRGALMEQAERIDKLEAALAARPFVPKIATPARAPAPAPAFVPDAAKVAAEVAATPRPKPAVAEPLPDSVAAFAKTEAPAAVPALVAVPARIVAPRIVSDIEAPPPPRAPLKPEGFRRTFDPPPVAAPAPEEEEKDEALPSEIVVSEEPAAEPSLAAPEPVLDEPAGEETAPALLAEEDISFEELTVTAEEPAAAPINEPALLPEAAPAEEATAPVAAPAPAPAPVARTTLRPEVYWWIGGGAITAGVIAALIVAYQAGFFNQLSQLLLGYFMAAGMIAGAEVLRRRQAVEPPTDWQARHTPKILAAAGVACAWGMSYVGLTRLYLPADMAMTMARPTLLPPGAALGFMGVAALGAFVLSLWHGRLVAWLGLAVGFAAPALVTAVTAAAPAFFAFLFAIAAATFALARYRHWHALAGSAAALALGWGAAWCTLFLLPSGMGAAAVYGVALVLLGVSLAWDGVTEPLAPTTLARFEMPWSAPAWIGVVTSVGATALLLAFAVRAEGAGGSAAMALTAVAALLALAAAFREGLAPTPLLAAAASLTALALWPPLLMPADARAFAGAAGLLGLASSIGGWLMMARNVAPAPGAALAALVPTVTLLIAYLRLGDLIVAPYGWGGIALVLAAFNGVALDAVSKAAGGASRAPGATAAFAAAAAACAVMAGAFAFDNVRMAAGLALLLAPLAWLDRRLDIPALRFAGAGFAAATLALLSPIALMRAEISPQPLINLIAPTFFIAILAVWAGARLFAQGPAGYEGRVTIFIRIALVALVLAFGFAEIRHLANGGDMTARYASLFEMGGHTAFLLVIACAIAWRYGKQDRPLLHMTEMFAFVIATAHMAIAGLGILAPWWGTEPALAPGQPVFNALLAAYALPAALFALYAWLRARMGPSLRAHVASGAALVSALVWLLLEVRRAFHPDAMAIGSISPAEHGAFSLALVVASALVVLAAMRIGRGPGATVLRIVAALLTAIGILKALALDIGLIDGPVRFAVYALVAAVGVGALIGYHRYVFPRGAGAENAGARNATLIPPRP